MKVLSAQQIRELDAYSIENEPIASIDLMERASLAFVNWFVEMFQDEERPIAIFCGCGNNGGDGLAVARLLYYRFFEITIYWCKVSDHCTHDFNINLQRLPPRRAIPVIEITKGSVFPELPSEVILIDAIFGSGLNRTVQGYWAGLIDHLNAINGSVVSIDIPSGLFADAHSKGGIIQADYTLSFELPKLAFLLPENHKYVGSWSFASIGLSLEFIEKLPTTNFYIDSNIVRSIVKKRRKFDHKGTFGHALLIMGSYGKAGAAVLASKACLRTGTGLVTTHIPRSAYPILQISIPEIMVRIDEHDHYISKCPDLKGFKAIGIGCGMDTKDVSLQALKELLQLTTLPLVVDADALNLLAANKLLFESIPKGSIFTPHPKEFERLFGKSNNHFDRIALLRQKASELGIYIVLKGAHTCIACPDGLCFFNSSGNPGMATAGSGDVLTGILIGLMAQGYTSVEACILGVFLHGLAGDIAIRNISAEALIASDIIDHINHAFQYLHQLN